MLQLDSMRLWKTPEPGDLFGRRFADLGCELFLILPTQILSLMSGKISSVKLDESFFYVPTFEEILRILHLKNLENLVQNVKVGKVNYADMLSLAEPYLASFYQKR